MSRVLVPWPVRLLSPLLLSLALFISVLSAAPVPPEVAEAAQAGLAAFLRDIPAGELANFGFAPDEDPLRSELGVPFPVYTITPEAIAGYREGQAVSSLISPTGSWYFPVILDKTMRTILTVARMEGGWEAVALGRTPLAGELEKVLARWPRASGYEPLIVKVFQAKEYLFTVPQVDDYNLSPFVFGEQGGGAGGGEPDEDRGYGALKNVGPNAERLRAAVADNLEQ